jgi:hypothetical protein
VVPELKTLVPIRPGAPTSLSDAAVSSYPNADQAGQREEMRPDDQGDNRYDMFRQTGLRQQVRGSNDKREFYHDDYGQPVHHSALASVRIARYGARRADGVQRQSNCDH